MEIMLFGLQLALTGLLIFQSSLSMCVPCFSPVSRCQIILCRQTYLYVPTYKCALSSLWNHKITIYIIITILMHMENCMRKKCVTEAANCRFHFSLNYNSCDNNNNYTYDILFTFLCCYDKLE